MTTDEVLKVFEQAKPVPTISEYEKEQLAIKSNYHRLRAERLAREATKSPNPNLPNHIPLGK
jgi:hypothetical protein